MVLVATAMAVLLAGCGSSQREAQVSSQSSEQEGGRSQQTSELTTNETVVGSTQQTSEPTKNETLVGRCADSGSTGGQQDEASGGEVSNGDIAFIRSIISDSDIYVIDGEGAHERRLTNTAQVFEDHPVWSPDGGKIAFTTQDQSELSLINVDGTHKVSLITASFAGNAENRTLFGSPVWSPTGNKIAFASRTLEEGYATASASASVPAPLEESLTGIYLINVDGTGLRKLTSTEFLADGLVWSPSGDQMAFHHKGTTHAINTDGSGRKLLVRGYSAV